MIDRVRSGEFYVIVPDNETPRVLDEIRILWAAGGVFPLCIDSSSGC